MNVLLLYCTCTFFKIDKYFADICLGNIDFFLQIFQGCYLLMNLNRLSKTKDQNFHPEGRCGCLRLRWREGVAIRQQSNDLLLFERANSLDWESWWMYCDFDCEESVL